MPACSTCGERIPGGNPRAHYVKCGGCRQTDDRPKVACALCGKEYRRLGPHFKVHGITRAEYQVQFPGFPVEVPGTRKRSEACRAKQSAAAKRRWSSEEERAAQSERLKESAPWKGKKLSRKHRAAISTGNTGVSHNISKENLRKMGERGKRVLEEVRGRPGYREKLSVAQKARHKRQPFGLADPHVLAKALATRRKNGVPQGAGRGINGFRQGLTHFTRSTLEANFARVLVAAGVGYDYEPRCFNLGEELGYYTPDFFTQSPLLTPNGDRVLLGAGWWELKGWRHKDGSLPGNAEEKLSALRKFVKEPVGVLVSSDHDWDFVKHFWSSLVLWELPRRNLRTHPELFGLR